MGFLIVMSKFSLIDRNFAVKTAYKISEKFTHPKLIKELAANGLFRTSDGHEYLLVNGEEVLK